MGMQLRWSTEVAVQRSPQGSHEAPKMNIQILKVKTLSEWSEMVKQYLIESEDTERMNENETIPQRR